MDVVWPVLPSETRREETIMSETLDPMPTQIDHQQPAVELVAKAHAGGMDLGGARWAADRTDQSVLETELEAELSAHLGHDKYDQSGVTVGIPGTGRGRRQC